MVWASLLLVGQLSGNTYLAGLQANEGGRTSLTLGDANIAAHYFFISAMIIAATRCPPNRLIRVLAYVLLLVAWMLCGSNSGIVELFLGLTLIAVLAVYRRSGAVPAIAFACCLLSLGVVVGSIVPLAQLQDSARDSKYRAIRDWVGRSEKTTGQRETLLRESANLYYRGGLAGEGPTSTIARLREDQAPFAREAHDDYVAALVERGALGAIGIMLLVGSVSVRTWAIERRPLAGLFAKVVPRTAPLLAAIAGTFVLATVYEVLHVRHVWALFGVVASLYYWGRQ
jgi:hypothetical protein